MPRRSARKSSMRKIGQTQTAVTPDGDTVYITPVEVSQHDVDWDAVHRGEIVPEVYKIETLTRHRHGGEHTWEEEELPRRGRSRTVKSGRKNKSLIELNL